MATVPTPRTWAVGELLTAAKLNTDLRDGLNFLLSPPLAALRHSTSQALNVGFSYLSFGIEDADRDGGHSNTTNNTRYTVQTAGWYRITAAVGISGTLITELALRKNAAAHYSAVSLDNSGGGGDTRMCAAWMNNLSVSDYVEIAVYCNVSTATLTSDNLPRFDLQWISKT